MLGDGQKQSAEETATGIDRDSGGRIREVCFEQLSGGGAEVIVEYAGNKYRLLATKNGRLVLNK